MLHNQRCLVFSAHSSRPGRPPKRLQSVTEGGTHHMLSHSGLLHAGIMPPAGNHPGLATPKIHRGSHTHPTRIVLVKKKSRSYVLITLATKLELFFFPLTVHIFILKPLYFKFTPSFLGQAIWLLLRCAFPLLQQSFNSFLISKRWSLILLKNIFFKS